MQDSVKLLPDQFVSADNILETEDLLLIVQKLTIAILIGLLIGLEREPWRNHKTYKGKYSSYKNRHDQKPIRDSRDLKYFANKNHPEHINWIKQQKHDKVIKMVLRKQMMVMNKIIIGTIIRKARTKNNRDLILQN